MLVLRRLRLKALKRRCLIPSGRDAGLAQVVTLFESVLAVASVLGARLVVLLRTRELLKTQLLRCLERIATCQVLSGSREVSGEEIEVRVDRVRVTTDHLALEEMEIGEKVAAAIVDLLDPTELEGIVATTDRVVALTEVSEVRVRDVLASTTVVSAESVRLAMHTGLRMKERKLAHGSIAALMSVVLDRAEVAMIVQAAIVVVKIAVLAVVASEPRVVDLSALNAGSHVIVSKL